MERDNYRIKLPERMRVYPIFHVSLLMPTNNPINQNDEILEEYEVERIEEDTWEPTAHLNCPEKVREYEDRQTKTGQAYRAPRDKRVSAQATEQSRIATPPHALDKRQN